MGTEGASVRCDFVKYARVVAVQELPGFSCGEAVATARTMFAERAASFDGVEVWSLTRRVYQMGAIARMPTMASPDPPTSSAVGANPAPRLLSFWRKATLITKHASDLGA